MVRQWQRESEREGWLIKLASAARNCHWQHASSDATEQQLRSAAKSSMVACDLRREVGKSDA